MLQHTTLLLIHNASLPLPAIVPTTCVVVLRFLGLSSAPLLLKVAWPKQTSKPPDPQFQCWELTTRLHQNGTTRLGAYPKPTLEDSFLSLQQDAKNLFCRCTEMQSSHGIDIHCRNGDRNYFSELSKDGFELASACCIDELPLGKRSPSQKR